MMALNGRFTSATSNWTLSVRKFSSVPNVTGSVMLPEGIPDVGPLQKMGERESAWTPGSAAV